MSSAAATLKEGLLGEYGFLPAVIGLLKILLLPTLGGVFLSPPVAEAVLDVYLTGSSLYYTLEPFVYAGSAIAMFGMVFWLQENVGHRAG